MDPNSEQFVRQLTAIQSSLHAYIMSLLPDASRADDLLQETNLTLWRKAEQFQEGTSFIGWACQVAYFKVLSKRRSLARDRHVFDEQLLDYLAERQGERAEQLPQHQVALRRCLRKLPEKQSKLVHDRYQHGGSVKKLAEQSGRSAAVISQTLYRIRNTLLKCIQESLAAEPSQSHEYSPKPSRT